MKSLGLLVFSAALFTLPNSVMSQDSDFGVNVYYGDAVNIGMNVKVSPSITLRPAVGVTNTSWNNSSLIIVSHLTTTVGLDLIFQLDSTIVSTKFHPFVGGGARYWYDEQRFFGAYDRNGDSPTPEL